MINVFEWSKRGKMQTNNYALELKGITKAFPGVIALDNIDFKLKKGTIHAICGENGAGKSTLMKIINGLYAPDSGEIYINGHEVHIKSPHDAKKLGIAMVFQELSYVPTMTVSENLFLNTWPKKGFLIDWKKIKKDASDLLKSENLNYDYDTLSGTLPISDLQMLEIVKATTNETNILILDEPTSALSNREIENLFTKLKQLRNEGVSIIYISHKLDEIFELSDEVTVLRDGTKIMTDTIDNLTNDGLIEHMVGRKIEQQFPSHTSVISDKYFEIRNLNKKGIFKDINFNVRKGEIVGFYGLVGAGRTELFECIFGLDSYDDGDILLDNKSISFKTIVDRIDAGLGYLTEDRSRTGIIPILSVKHNISLASLKNYFFDGRWHRQIENESVIRIGESVSIKTPGYDVPINNLSGGNQQKALLGKWLLCNPNLLIVDEPTRGIDVDAKREIY